MDNAFTIIGGGIAGLTTAIALKRVGIKVQVIEATPEFRTIGAGLSLAANAMQAFREIGIADAVIAAGRSLNKFTIYDQKGKPINTTVTNPQESKYGISNFTIHRAALHQVLYSFLSPEEVILGKRSTDFEQLADGYRVLFEDGSSINSKNLIVAEGIHSPIRKKLAPNARIRYAGYTCWRGVIDNNMSISETSETWGVNGRFGIVPLANNQIYWFATKSVREPASDLKEYTITDLVSNFRNYHEPIGNILKSTPQEAVIWNDIIDLEPLDRYAFGDIVLIGDAAHATTPNLGQGACMAIEDAVVLANCLKDHSGVSDAFRRFEQKRLRRTHQIVKSSWQMGKIAQLENPLMASVRNGLLRIAPKTVMNKQIDWLYDVSFD